jgi:hypothetical protein
MPPHGNFAGQSVLTIRRVSGLPGRISGGQAEGIFRRPPWLGSRSGRAPGRRARGLRRSGPSLGRAHRPGHGLSRATVPRSPRRARIFFLTLGENENRDAENQRPASRLDQERPRPTPVGRHRRKLPPSQRTNRASDQTRTNRGFRRPGNPLPSPPPRLTDHAPDGRPALPAPSEERLPQPLRVRESRQSGRACGPPTRPRVPDENCFFIGRLAPETSRPRFANSPSREIRSPR